MPFGRPDSLEPNAKSSSRLPAAFVQIAGDIEIRLGHLACECVSVHLAAGRPALVLSLGRLLGSAGPLLAAVL